MKNEYLNTLKELLDRYQMDESEKEDIVNDYNDMYENYLDYGMNEEEVEKKLGSPKSIIGSLTEGYKRVPQKQGKSSKIIAIMPFVALILFFVGGFVFDAWTYSWLAFLLIPMSAIVLEMGKKRDEQLTTALSPFIALIAFFILGFGYGLWHPGWAVFLIIPILGIFNSRGTMKPFELLTALSPFIAIVVYLILVELYGLWHPGWLVFLIIPALGLLNEKRIGVMLISETLLIGGALAYLYVGYNFDDMWAYGALVFLPFVLYSMYVGHISITSDNANISKGYKLVVIITVIAYFIVSFATNYWAITWIIYFAIPVYAIIKESHGNSRIIALTPFVAVSIFMLLGFFFNAWAFAWIAFLLIPITAILKS